MEVPSWVPKIKGYSLPTLILPSEGVIKESKHFKIFLLREGILFMTVALGTFHSGTRTGGTCSIAVYYLIYGSPRGEPRFHIAGGVR